MTTELEKKMLISKDEYEYLMQYFSCENPLLPKPIIKQVNYYFDTDDFLMNQKNITCRIRLKDGKYKATFKHHSIGSDHSTETPAVIYNGLEHNSFIDMGLKLQGSLVTERCVVLKDRGCEVILDKNTYLDYEDYEIEIEYSSEGKAVAESIMQLLFNILLRRKCFLIYLDDFLDGFRKKPRTSNKANRFFERKILSKEIPKTRTSNTQSDANPTIQKKETPNVSETDEPLKFKCFDMNDYLTGLYGPILPDSEKCVSCSYFNGASCVSPQGMCGNERY